MDQARPVVVPKRMRRTITRVRGRSDSDMRCLVANQAGHMNAGWEAGCRGNTFFESAWCASILSWCSYC